MNKKRKIVVAITGASGTIYGIQLLKALHTIDQIEVHLVMSNWAMQNLKTETDYDLSTVESFADTVYSVRNQGAKISSGSFQVDSMVIVPASMKTVASIANGYADNLIARVADVMLKEQRKLILVPRETPLNLIHLQNLTKLATMGVQIIPPMPAFYNHPKTILDLINHQTMKVLDALHIDNSFSGRLEGL